MGALVSGIGGYEAGQVNSATAETNAKLAGMNASDAAARGSIKAANIQGQGTQVIGRQATGYAASGVDASAGGTPMQVMADSRMMSSLDALTARNNAAREAWGYKVQGYNYGQQANLDQTNAGFSLGAGVASTGTQAMTALAGGA